MSNTIKILITGKRKHDNSLSIITVRQINSLREYSKKHLSGSIIFDFTDLPNYMRSFFYLNREVKTLKPDIIHAHYSLIGLLSILASNKQKVVVSFMGSDVYQQGFIFNLARKIVLKRADHVIVKSKRLLDKLPPSEHITIIPNGVDIDLFKPENKRESKNKLGWSEDKIHILFPANKKRFEKNYALANNSIRELGEKHDTELHVLDNEDPSRVPVYLNAADIVLLTSKWEGSSNVTKEAMACNTVVVSTNVGDADSLFADVPGYFIASQSQESIVKALEEAVSFISKQGKPLGRKRIIELKLDDQSVAQQIVDVYKGLL